MNGAETQVYLRQFLCEVCGLTGGWALDEGIESGEELGADVVGLAQDLMARFRNDHEGKTGAPGEAACRLGVDDPVAARRNDEHRYAEMARARDLADLVHRRKGGHHPSIGRSAKTEIRRGIERGDGAGKPAAKSSKNAAI